MKAVFLVNFVFQLKTNIINLTKIVSHNITIRTCFSLRNYVKKFTVNTNVRLRDKSSYHSAREMSDVVEDERRKSKREKICRVIGLGILASILLVIPIFLVIEGVQVNIFRILE